MTEPTSARQEDSSGIGKNASAVPAHELYIELATRITTRRLHYRAGDEESAAESIYSLFQTTRKLMGKYPDAPSFQTVSLALLNDILRPYTARWHGWMTHEGNEVDKNQQPIRKFRDEWIKRKFRQELRELQPVLLGVQKYLHAMSLDKVPDVTLLNPAYGSPSFKELAKECDADRSADCLGNAILLKLRDEVALYGADEKGRAKATLLTHNIADAERIFIARRRSAMNAEKVAPGDVQDTVGLALSGGGIRSATFCLGIVQTLQRRGIFNQIDYLSTVSGGGYLGAFLSSYLGTDNTSESNSGSSAVDADSHSEKHSPLARVDAALGSTDEGQPESKPVRHLRNNSKFLLDRDGWGKLHIAAVMVFGFLESLLMLLTIPLLIAWLTLSVERLSQTDFLSQIKLPVSRTPDIFKQPVGPLLAGLLILLGLLWLLKSAVGRWTQGKPWKSSSAKFSRFTYDAWLLLFVVTLPTAGLCCSFLLIKGYNDSATSFATIRSALNLPDIPNWIAVIMTGAIPFLFGALSKRRDGQSRKWAAWLFYLTGPAFFLLAFVVFASHLGVGSTTREPLDAWAWVTAALIIWSLFFVNINNFSLHRYYRDRLSKCYLAVPRKPELSPVERGFDNLMHGSSRDKQHETTSVGTAKSIPLTALGVSTAAPYHLINAVLNAENSKNPELRGRNGDFFIFSRHYCGSPLTGYVTTETLESVDPGLDLGTAMAISGAAASTNMGWKTLRSFRFLMALFNVRLGYWMRRPGSRPWPRLFEGPGPLYFLREMLGSVHEGLRYVNLSDGGHIENLAAYELLRRQCKFIVCIDAGMEPGMECADLMRLQRYASIDFGIQLHFDPSDFTILPTTYSRAYAILVKIDYAPSQANSDRETSDQLGWMLYMKLAVTGTEPRHVLDYRRQYPAFPHQSTADQLYDEAQFESYRALGQCAAQSLFSSEIVGQNASEKLAVRSWFQYLSHNLLADNDEVFRK